MKDLLDAPAGKPKSFLSQRAPGTAILWAVLVLMFVSIYQLFTGPSPGGWLPLAIPCAVLVAAAGLTFAIRFITVRFNRENAAAIALLKKGAYDQAAEAFESLLRRHPRMRHLRAVARHNAGLARLRQGQLERAIELLTLVVNDKRVPRLKASAASELAAACALDGRLDEAEAWLAKAEAVPSVSGFALAWPRTLLMARRGAFTELARMLEARWRELESTLSGETMRRMLLLHAFAVASADGPRSAGAAEPLIVRLRASAPGEHRWLAARWPELGAFLETNQL